MPARYTHLAVPEQHSDTFGARTGSPAIDATVTFATALVQDGVSRVRVIVPREPGVLARARDAARVAGVSLHAENVGSASITMRFSPPPGAVAQTRQPDGDHRRAAWRRLLGWLGR